MKDIRGNDKLVDRLNEIGVRWAESRHKTFHCITPDCGQWWFIEQIQGNNIVYCDVCILFFPDLFCIVRCFLKGCKHWICITCVAMHEGRNCKSHQ